MATQPRFCGNCGAQVPPDAPYCGRCGAPLPPRATAIPSFYTYPSAQPRRLTGVGRVSGAQIAVAAALVIILSVVSVALSLFAVSRVIGTRKACISKCGAKIVTPLPAPAAYKSSTFGFEVDYNPSWTVRSQDSQGIVLATKLGLLQVTGAKSGQPLQEVIQSAISALPSSTWQDVFHVTDLKGAHVGDQDGIGSIYSANLIGSNAKAVKVRFFVIAATKGGVTVVILGVNPADTKNYPNGIPEGQEFDTLCQQFQWASG